MSYFAKPNFLIYDEWFDNDLENVEFDFRKKKTNSISKIHEFFYEQSNYKVGASENNFQYNINVNKKELLNNNYLGKNSEKLTLISNKKFRFLKNLYKSKLKFNIPNKLIYSLSIFSFIFISSFLIFFLQSEKNKTNISNRFLTLEKEF